jgi:hypothetical protein
LLRNCIEPDVYFGLAADQVEHRRLAGAIGTDDDANFVFVNVEEKIVDRLNPLNDTRHKAFASTT